MSVKLISVTPDAEKMMAYVARVSNPNNQENPNYAKPSPRPLQNLNIAHIQTLPKMECIVSNFWMS